MQQAAENEEDDQMSLDTYIPRKEIKLDFDESNIIDRPRKRKATEDFSEVTYKKQGQHFSYLFYRTKVIQAFYTPSQQPSTGCLT